MARVYTRRFDWGDAKRRYEAGETAKALAADYGVSETAIYNAANPEKYARALAITRQWQRTGVCPECGGRMSRKNASLCYSCRNRARATSVREHELCCFSCKQWQPDSAFPNNKGEQARRGKHGYCRKCCTLAKRDWRERKREALL